MGSDFTLTQWFGVGHDRYRFGSSGDGLESHGSTSSPPYLGGLDDAHGATRSALRHRSAVHARPAEFRVTDMSPLNGVVEVVNVWPNVAPLVPLTGNL
jgi:hypothetical protein